MIKRLRKKITLIILFAISIPLLFIIAFYDFSYYNNIVRVNTQFIDRFFINPNDFINDRKEEPFNSFDTNGIYSISLINGNIYRSSDNTNEEINK